MARGDNRIPLESVSGVASVGLADAVSCRGVQVVTRSAGQAIEEQRSKLAAAGNRGRSLIDDIQTDVAIGLHHLAAIDPLNRVVASSVVQVEVVVLEQSEIQ